MGHNQSQSKRRAAIMAGRLADYTDWTLVVICPRCRERRDVRVRNLVARHGGHHKVEAIVGRLRCGYLKCGAEPSAVTIINALHTVILLGPGAFG